MLASCVLSVAVNGFSSSPKLYKCLKSFKKGHRFDCSNGNGNSIHEQICCKFFKSKRRQGRRAKLLQKVPDLNFRQDFDDAYNHEPEAEVLPPAVVNKRIKYNFAKSKKTVQIPQYDAYNQEPEAEVSELSNEIEQQPNEARQFSETEGAQRRGIVLDDSASELKKAFDRKKQKQSVNRIGAASFFAHHDHMLSGNGKGYNRDLCATLLVPCRFVTDHPCCNYEMPMDLVARSRALDGSADLKWRPVSLGGPRTAGQGRSLFRNKKMLPPAVVNKRIKYNFAKSKKTVQIPQYHYDGGPEMTSTIVGLCWRLHYIQCPPTGGGGSDGSSAAVGGTKSNPVWVIAQKVKKIHPCCQILSRPSQGSSPLASRVSRWLHHNPALV